MARTSNAVMEARKAALLAHLESLAESGEPPCPSYGELGESLGLTGGQVRRICRSLQKEGALRVEPRYLENGAQLENAYALTPSGMQRALRWRLRSAPSLAVGQASGSLPTEERTRVHQAPVRGMAR